MHRHLFTLLGWLAVGLGLIGVVLPVLPTVPFIILAAFLFARGSPAAREWLLEHRHFGPHITAWEERGSISRRAKMLAVTSMIAVFAVSSVLGVPGWVMAIQGLCLTGAALFVLTRPD